MPLFNEDLPQSTPLPGTPPVPDTFAGPYQKPAQQSFFELGQAPSDGTRASTYEELVKGIESKNLGITPNTPQNPLSKATLLDNSKFPSYRPGADLEDIYGQSQSWYNKLGNSLVKFAATTVGTFAQGFATIPDTIEAINNGKVSALSNKDGYENDIDNWQKQLENDFPNYYTKWEREHPFASAIPFSGGAINFWGDQVIKNLGFTAGAIGSAVVQDAIVGVVTGGVGEIPLISSQVGKLSLYFNRLLSGSSRAAEFINNVKTLGLSAEKTALLTNYATEKFGAAVLNKTANSFRYGLNLYGSARTEGAVESRDGYRSLKQDLINNYKENNLGQEPIGKDLTDIENASVAAMNTRFGINMALLTISDAVQFDNILKTFNFSKSAIKDVEGIGRIGLSKTSPLDNIEQIKTPTFAGRVWDVVRPALPNIFAEGVYEEGGQYATQTGTSNYYKNKYLSQKAHDRGEIDPTTGQIVSVKDGINDVINSTVYGLGQQFGTTEGIQNMFLGALTTMISSPISNKISGVNRKEERQALLNAANSQGITGVLRNNYEDTVSSAQIVADMKQATKDNNLFAYKNLKGDLFYKFVQAGINSGRLDLKIEQLKLLKELPDADFKEKFGIENTADNKKLVSQYVDNLIVKAEEIAKTSKLVDNIYVNPYTLHKTPQTPAQVAEVAAYHKFNDYKNELTYLSSTNKDADNRIQGINADIRAISPLVSGTLAANLISPEYLDALQKDYREQAKQLIELGDKDSITRAALFTTQASKIEQAKTSKTQEDLLAMYKSVMNFELNSQDVGEDKIGIEAPSLMQQGHDINQLNSRKKAMTDAYEFLSSKQGFEDYNQQDPTDFEEETDVPKEKESIIIPTKKGDTEVELGTEYMLGDVEEEGPNGTTIFRHPTLTILKENEDGTIKIKDGQGQIRDVSKDVLSKYKLSPAANVLNDKTANYFRLHRNTVFEYNFGKASKEGKRKGRLVYDNGKLFFKYVSYTGKVKSVQLFKEHFVAQEGFSQARIKPLYDLQIQTEEQKKAEEEFKAQEETDKISEKRDVRIKLIADLHAETSKSLEETNKKIAEKAEQLNKINEELEALKQKAEKTALPRTKREKALENKYPELSASTTRFNKVLKTVPKAISKLSTLKEDVEYEINKLTAEKEEAEFVLSYVEDMQQNLDELPTDSHEFLKELQDQVDWTKELIKETASTLSTLGTLSKNITDAIKELAQFLKQAFQKFDADYPSYIKDGYDRIIAGGSLVAEIPAIKEYIADYTLQSDTTKEIKINENKLEEAQRKIDETYANLLELSNELTAKQAILDKFQGVVDQLKAKEKAEQEARKNVEFQALMFNKTKQLELESGVQTDSPEQQTEAEIKHTEARKDAKRNISTISGTINPEEEDKRESNKRHEKFLNEVDLFPNRANIFQTYVTANNEEAFGLTGITQTYLGGYSPKEGEELILALYIEQTPEGQYFVDVEGKRIGKVGEPIDQNKIVFGPMTSTRMSSQKHGDRYSGENTEAWQKAWKEKRDEILALKGQSYTVEFNTSRGIPITNGKKNSIVGNLVTEQQLNDGKKLLQVSTTGTIQHQGKDVNIPIGRVMIQNGSTLEYANNRNLNEKEAKGVFAVLKEFVRQANNKEGFNPKFTQFLQGVLFFSSPYSKDASGEYTRPTLENGENKKLGRNQFYFHKGDFYFGEKEFPIPFTSESMEANKDAIMAFLLGAYNHVNDKMLTNNRTFIEYNENLEEKHWPTYQHYLLSTEGRKQEEVPLSTTIRPIDPLIPNDRNFLNKYSYAPSLISKEEVVPVVEEKAEEQQTAPVDTTGMSNSERVAAYLASLANKTTPAPKATGGFNIDNFKGQGEEAPVGNNGIVSFSDVMAADASKVEEPTPQKIEGGIAAKLRADRIAREKAGENNTEEPQNRLVGAYNYSLANIEEELAELERISPIPIATVKNLIAAGNGLYAFGQYLNGLITLSEQMETGTGYHELFHGIFDAFLSKKERDSLYKEFSERKGIFTERLTGDEIEYSKATIGQANEQMAEEFRDFKLYGQLPSNVSSKGGIVKFFQDLFNWIASMFTGKVNNLNDFFKKMDSAYYKNAPFKGISSASPQFRTQIGGLNSLDTQTVIQGIAGMVFQKLTAIGKFQNYKLLNDLDFGEKIPKVIYDEVRKDVEISLGTTWYNQLKSEGYVDEAIYNKIDPVITAVLEDQNWAKFVKASGEFLKTFKILQEEEEQDKEGEDSTYTNGEDGYLRDAFTYDGKKNAPATIKLFLGTIQQSAFKEKGLQATTPGQAQTLRPIVAERDPSTGMPIMMDFANVYNDLMHNLIDYNTLEDKERRITQLAQTRPEYVRIYNRLKIGNDNLSIAELDFKVKFYNTFAKQSPKALNTYIGDDGLTYIGPAELDTPIKLLQSDFLANLKDSPAVSFNTERRKYILNINHAANGKMTFPKHSSPIEYLKAFGIVFTKTQQENMTSKQEKDLEAAVKGFRENIKTDVSSIRSLGVEGRLKEIFRIFLESQNLVPNSVFTNLEGNNRASVVNTNFYSRAMNDINSAKTREQLFQLLPHLQFPYSKDSYYVNNGWFNAEGKSLEQTLTTSYNQGIVTPNQDKNEPIDKLTEAKRLAQAINQNLRENYYMLLPADSQTEWAMKLKNIFRSFTKEASEQFYSYYQTEQSLGGSKERTFSFLKDGLSFQEFDKQFREFVNKAIEQQFKQLSDNGIIANNPNGTYTWNGLDKDFAEEFKFSPKALSIADVNDILTYRTINFMFNNIEIHKVFFGDPAAYGKDGTKRFKTFGSPREQSIYGYPQYNEVGNKTYNTVAGVQLKQGDPGFLFWSDELKTVTMQDVLSLNELKGYEEVNGTDGGAIAPLVSARQIMKKSARLDSRQEAVIDYALAEDRLLMALDGLYDYTGKEALEKHDRELTSKPLVSDAKISPLKPVVSGFDDNGPILDKYSIAFITYKAVRKTNLAAQYKRMLDENISYTIYESGRKVGKQGMDKMYNADGSPNTAPYTASSIINVPFKWFGIQVETGGDVSSQTWGSQTGKLITANLLNAGVPIDFKGTYDEWNALPEDKRSTPISTLVDRERNIREAMIENGYKELISKLGVNEDGTVSKEKLLSLIKDELTRRELNDNIKEALQIKEDGDFLIPLEALNNYEQIKSIIFSYVHKYISAPKVGGGAKIMVSGSGWEIEGHRIVKGKDKDGREIFTSAGLHNYTKEEPWTGVLIGNWFADKLRNVPGLQGKTNKEIFDILNNTEEGKKILNGVGFRIPTQELNSIENFKIEGFLPEEFRGMVVVAESITTKSGGDFDVDKLNTYLKNIYVNDKGEIKLVPYFKDKAKGDEFYEEEFFKLVDAKAKRVEEKKQKQFNLREVFGELAYGSPSEEYKNKWTAIISDIFSDVIEDLEGQDKTIAIEEAFLKNLEALGKEEKDLSDWDVQEVLLKKFQDKMYKQSLENEYYSILSDIITLPENFERLVSPNHSNELKSLRDTLVDKVPEEFGQGAIKSILSPTYMNTLRHMYISGKNLVGIPASAQVQNAVSQKTPVIIDPSRISQLKDDNERKYIGNASVLLPSNTVTIKGKTFPTISKATDTDLSTKNSLGRYISEKISQFINGFVDITKDPFLVQLGVNNNNAGLFMFLERIGVPTTTTVYFMNQPIIREYQKMLERNNVSYPFITDREEKDFGIDIIRQQFPYSAPIPSSYNKKGLDSSLLENITDFYNGKLSNEQNAQQQFILSEFLKYSVMASNLFRLSQATNYDTTRFSNPYLFLRKLLKQQDAETNNIFSSAKGVLDSVFVGKIAQRIGDAMSLISNGYFKFLHSDITPYIFPIVYKLAERKKMNDQDFLKASRKVEQAFISYLIQNTVGKDGRPINEDISSLLINEETSAAKLLNKLKTEYRNKPNNPFKILDRFIGVDKSSPTAAKTIRIFDKPRTAFEQNVFIGAMEELKDNPKTTELYGKLLRVAFLQSGIAQTPFSFSEIIPVQDFKEFIYPAIKALYNKELLEQFEATDTFYKNSWRDPIIVPRNALKYDMYGNVKNQFGNQKIDELANSNVQALATSRGISNFPIYKVSTKAANYTSDFITMQLGTKEQPALYLLKKLYKPNGEPFLRPYSKDPNYGEYALYYPVKPLGDGYKGQEHYTNTRSSVFKDTEAISPAAELSPQEIISAIQGINTPLTNNVVPLQGMQQREYTPENITTLKPNEVFVFGANTAGGHGGGTAGIAQRGTPSSNYTALPVGTKGKWSEYGVVDKLMQGTEGKSFGIVTKAASINGDKLSIGAKRSVSLERIETSVKALIESAKQNPDLKFLVTKFGTNMAGFTEQEMKNILNKYSGTLPSNIILSREFEVRSTKQSAPTEEDFEAFKNSLDRKDCQ